MYTEQRKARRGRKRICGKMRHMGNPTEEAVAGSQNENKFGSSPSNAVWTLLFCVAKAALAVAAADGGFGKFMISVQCRDLTMSGCCANQSLETTYAKLSQHSTRLHLRVRTLSNDFVESRIRLYDTLGLLFSLGYQSASP